MEDEMDRGGKTLKTPPAGNGIKFDCKCFKTKTIHFDLFKKLITEL